MVDEVAHNEVITAEEETEAVEEGVEAEDVAEVEGGCGRAGNNLGTSDKPGASRPC